MSKQAADQFRIYANGTYVPKKVPGHSSLILKFDKERLEELLNELDQKDYLEKGATIFLNVFENDSDHNPGEKYLSTSIAAVPTEPYNREEAVRGKGGSSRANADTAVAAYDKKVRGRRGQ